MRASAKFFSGYYWALGFVACAALFGCAGHKEAVLAEFEKEQELKAIYVSLDGQWQIDCFEEFGHAGMSTCTTIERVSAGLTIYEGSGVFENCSDQNYRCVTSTSTLFAVPKDLKLTRGLSYSVNGSTLVVEECYGDVDGICSTAVISTKCEDSRCNCMGATLDPSDTLTHFWFDSERGITAFGSFRAMAEFGLTSDQSSRVFVLAKPLGLLRADFPTAPFALGQVPVCSFNQVEEP